MISLYSGLVVKEPLVRTLLPLFESSSGVDVATTFEPTSVLLRRIADGERPDVVLGVASSLGDLAGEGIIDPESIREIGVSAVGFARLPGTPGPTDSSVEAFLDYLLAARAVAYSLSGASGLHFINLLTQRGLTDRIDERSIRFPSGLTADALADGRADVAIQQVSELRAVPGAHIVEPIPHDLQSYARFAVGARPGAPAAAKELIAALTSARARRAFTDAGLSTPSTPMSTPDA